MPYATAGRAAVRSLLPLVLLAAAAFPARAQISLTATGTPTVETFDGFQGAGFAPDPAAGQYDSDNVAIAGTFSDGDLAYGGTATAGDLARGVANDGAPTTAGVYAYDDGADQWLWVQPTGNEFTPGTMTLRFQNNTGEVLTRVDVAYDVKVYNDQPRANSWNASYSTDDVSYTDATAYTTTEAADAEPAWQTVAQSFSADGLTIVPGAFFYVRFTSDDVGGSGGRDQIGVDNVSATGLSGGPVRPAVRFTASGDTGDEGGTVTLSVELDYPDDAPDGNPVTVAIDFLPASSTADTDDFSGPTPATLTFSGNADNETQDVTVTLADGDGFEGEEAAAFALSVTAGDAAVGAPATFTITIADADAPTTMTFAEARAAGVGASVTVLGTVTRAEGNFTYFQDETGGLAIRQTSGPFFEAVANGTIQSGIALLVTGTLSEFNGLLQISGADLEDYEVLGPGTIFEPQVVDLATLAADGEAYESEFVLVRALGVQTGDEVFQAGATYTIVDPSDDSGAVTLHVPNAADTEVEGTPVPEGLFTFTGVVAQFDASGPHDEGYQLLAIGEGDVETLTVLDIADARMQAVGDTVSVSGVVTRALGRAMRIQDSTAGIATFEQTGPLADAIAAGAVAPGDRVLVTGVLAEFNGLLQFNPVQGFTVLERGVPLPAPQFVTLAELEANGEAYESELVAVLADVNTPDDTFQANRSYDLFDGLGENGAVVLRIEAAAQSELVGQPIPEGNFVFVGVVAQFDASDPRDEGYQLNPVHLGDIYVPEYFALLGGGQEVVPVPTAASGFVAATVAGSQISVTGSFRDLTSPYAASHLHLGYAGQNGPVTIPLNPQVGPDGLTGAFVAEENVFPITPEQLEALEARRIYANVHSQGFPAGEVRGQLVPAHADVYAWHALAGSSEVPFNTSDARGAVIAEFYLIEDSELVEVVLSGSFEGLEGTYQASHLHVGIPGRNGPVFQGLTATVEGGTAGVFTVADNTYQLGVGDLIGEGLYLNVHSSVYPGGEIRGHLLGLGQTFHHAALLPENEVPEVTGSEAVGGAALTSFNGQVALTASFSGLSSEFQAAHIHVGEAGEAGAVVVPLEVTVGDEGRSGSVRQLIPLTDEQFALALEEGLYINVHSADYPAGELRGQILLAPNRAPDAPALTAPADGATVVIAGDGGQVLSVEWDGAADPDGDRVVYVWQLAIAETFGADEVLVALNAGTEGGLGATYAEVDSILTAAGVPVGATVTGYHRVLASDGSVFAASDTFEVTLTRGVVAGEGGPEVPTAYALEGSFPNPTAGASTLRFDLPEPASVRVEVYDVLGRRVLTVEPTTLEAARHRMALDTGRLPSGAYLYRLMAEGASQRFEATGRLTVVR